MIKDNSHQSDASSESGNVGSIGQRVKHQRNKLELSQAKLAELSGVSLPTIKNIELDKRATPRGETILKLSEALQVTPQFLRKGEEMG